MILRIWRGTTLAAKADAYAEVLERIGTSNYRATPGNLDAQVVRRIVGDRAEFLTITWWESYDAIRAFAGDDIARAIYYPEDDEYLLDREPTVAHYEVLANQPEGPLPDGQQPA